MNPLEPPPGPRPAYHTGPWPWPYDTTKPPTSPAPSPRTSDVVAGAAFTVTALVAAVALLIYSPALCVFLTIVIAAAAPALTRRRTR